MRGWDWGEHVCVWSSWDQLWEAPRDDAAENRRGYGGGSRVFTFGWAKWSGGGQGEGTEGLGSTGVWGRHAEGPPGPGAEVRAGLAWAGLQGAVYHVGRPSTESALYTHSSPGPSLPPWGGKLCGSSVPMSGSVGRAGGSEPALSHGLGKIQLLRDLGHPGQL